MDDCGANSYLPHKICGKIKAYKDKIKNCAVIPLMTAFVFFRGTDFDYSYQLDN